jgi:predicted metalloprotease
MRWTPGNRGNIEDLRGRSAVRGAGTIGIGGFVVLLALSWATGTDFLSMFSGGLPMESGSTSGELRTTPEEEQMVDFVDVVAADTQATWQRLLGSRYQPTRVVLFRDAIDSGGCGFAQSATGPFYCPGDQKVYLDLGFFNELSRGLGAEGDFARAYVIAHEFGHHVQNLLGYNERVRANPRPGAESASVALELQADCFAGVWGHDASQSGRAAAGKPELDPGDAEEGLRAAAAIGDDRLQKMSTGRVAPERFTHGTSAQRMEWFRRGLQSGDPRQCDTFQ